MQTLTIDGAAAKKLYPSASDDLKKMLEAEFGADFFKPKDITGEINDWDDIIRLSGKYAGDYELRHGETNDELAYRKAKLIATVYNRGDVLHAGDTDQWKYCPWHKIVKYSSKQSGFGLSYYVCGDWSSRSGVGVRLCFPNWDMAKFFGIRFLTLHKDHHLYT